MVKRLVGILAAVAVVISVGSCVPWKLNPSRPAAEAKYLRAQAQTVLLRDSTGQASGFVVIRKNALGQKRVFIWTAAHVVKDAPELDAVRIFHSNGHKAGYAVFKARCVVFSEKYDLALLLVDCPADFFTPTEFALKDAVLGEHVFIVGNALGEAFDGNVTQGTVSQVGVRPFEDPSWHWGCDLDQTTAIIVPGNSGGPVYNDKGQVIGVAVGWTRLPGIGVYVPLREILKWTSGCGISWAVKGSYCISDKFLEESIALSKTLLTPPPAPPAPDVSEPPCRK